MVNEPVPVPAEPHQCTYMQEKAVRSHKAVMRARVTLSKLARKLERQSNVDSGQLCTVCFWRMSVAQWQNQVQLGFGNHACVLHHWVIVVYADAGSFK